GPHPPRLWPEDVDLVHKLWLDLKARGPGSKLHHRDVVGVALRRMAAELASDRAGEVIRDVEHEVASSAAEHVMPGPYRTRQLSSRAAVPPTSISSRPSPIARRARLPRCDTARTFRRPPDAPAASGCRSPAETAPIASPAESSSAPSEARHRR